MIKQVEHKKKNKQQNKITKLWRLCDVNYQILDQIYFKCHIYTHTYMMKECYKRMHFFLNLICIDCCHQYLLI